MSTETSSTLDEILRALMAYARQDFSLRIPVSERGDEIDAIATGINLLAEELDGEVASRRELEAAYAKVQATQAQLVIAEKYAAIGQLANGVAHELNNPASWVLLGLDHSRKKLAEARALASGNAVLRELLAGIDSTLTDVHAGMERIRTVIGDLRTLSRVDSDLHSVVDLNEIVRATCQLAQPAYRGVASLELRLGHVPPLLGDRVRLGQLITNLLVNAAHAVGDGGSNHQIAVVTETDGTHVTLAVEDSGPGIPAELHEHVFDPYFTTKPSEIGTGLGLALVRKIADRHGGAARIARGTLAGARVEVRFPIVDDLPEDATVTVVDRALARAQGRSRILVIDDEPMLLRSLVSTIGDEHDVVTALGGQRGLELLARDQAFRLIVCDLQMPYVDGMSIHDAIKRDHPALLPCLVFMSGGAVTPRATQFLERERPRVIGKPIDIEELLELAATSACVSD
ncbi:MAG: Sensory box histidine kinase/response regulator [Rhizobium sp.]|nr:Sensory box histidine kinase/response regulator [Rhizobium sp.]